MLRLFQKYVNVVTFTHVADHSPAAGQPACPPTGPRSAAGTIEGEAPPDLRDPQLHDVVEHLGGALADAGLARLPARVFAALMATEDGRLTSSELATMLDISPAGVSGAVRYLSQLRMIRRERERGSRRDVYVVMDDAWHDMLMQCDQIYAPIRAPSPRPAASWGSDTRAGERMELSVEFLEFVRARWPASPSAGTSTRPTAADGIRPSFRPRATCLRFSPTTEPEPVGKSHEVGLAGWRKAARGATASE